MDEKKVLLERAEDALDHTGAYQWTMPPEAHEVALQRVAWTQLRKRAKFTKVMSGWSKFSGKCDDGNTRSFYYHPEKGESQWDAPPEVLGLKEGQRL